MEEIEDKIRDFILKEITWEKPEELDSDTQLIENCSHRLYCHVSFSRFRGRGI